MRATLVQASWCLIRKDGVMRERYEKIKVRAGGKRAIVAIETVIDKNAENIIGWNAVCFRSTLVSRIVILGYREAWRTTFRCLWVIDYV